MQRQPKGHEQRRSQGSGEPTPGPAAVQYVHNAACETAAQAGCRRFCHGAGHQDNRVNRAAGYPTTADQTALANLTGRKQHSRQPRRLRRRQATVPSGLA